MLFNSLIFIFAFLPASLAGYYALCATPLRGLRFAFLSLMSLAFYAWASFEFALLLCASTAFNLLWAQLVASCRERGGERRLQAVLYAGLAANLLFLCYFKYTNFLISNVDAALGWRMALQHIVLPIGISFYTFMFMGCLVDVARGDIARVVPAHFISYALFYPHLLAGPLVHYQELAPQMERLPRWHRVAGHLSVGTVMFAIGLFKKTVLADTLSIYADRAFGFVESGHHPGFAACWLGVLSFSLQIYFDFSGYSDMAIGVARMFGFRFPLNFFSPFRARNIADYWRRWHMSLNRFIVAYLYPALSISLARWSIARDLSKLPDFIVSVAVPLVITFVVVGLWHGAGWTYILFGVMHGIYVTIHEAWRAFAKKKRSHKPTAAMAVASQALTLLCVFFANAMFRAKTVGEAGVFFGAMLGLGGSDRLAAPYGALAAPTNWLLVAVGWLMVLTLPNTQQLLTRYSPALAWNRWRQVSPPAVLIQVRRNLVWAVATGLLLFFGILFVSRAQTVFIYFQF